MIEQEDRKKLAAWGVILNDIGALIDRTMARSTGTEGKTDDPRIISFFLMRRLRGHRNAFALLTNANLQIDAEIILRAAIETAICMRNLQVRGKAFFEDLKSDAARTIKGQIPHWFEVDPDLGEEASDGLDLLFGVTRADGAKHTLFKWSTLADDAAIPQLYRWYKHLSGTSAHVSGVSIFLDGFPDDRADQLRQMRPVHALGMMCGATLIGCRGHLGILDYEDLDADAADIMVRMAAVG